MSSVGSCDFYSTSTSTSSSCSESNENGKNEGKTTMETAVDKEHAILVEAVAHEIEDSDFYPAFLQSVKGQLENIHCNTIQSFRESLMRTMESSGLQGQLENFIYHLLQLNPHLYNPWIPSTNHKEPLDFIRKCQMNWEKRICKSLNSICAELGIPLARKRPISEQKEMEAMWQELSTQDPDLSQFRPVYAAKDFLDVLINLRSPNCREFIDKRFRTCWGSIHIHLRVKTFEELKKQYSDLVENNDHLGMTMGTVNAELANAKMILGRKVIPSKYALLAREFAKNGCPQSLRGKIWSVSLGVEITDKEKLYYDQLTTFVFQHDLLLDKLIYKDVKLTASNDDQYFVFEDYLHQIMLMFSRDTAVLSHFSHSSANPPKALLRGKLDMEEVTVVYPPNGVIPFHGFSMYIAPLCYLYDEPIQLYFVFREMYTRYFFRLHCVSSNIQGALCLCVLFEKLLRNQEQELCQHFRRFKIDPLRITFRWIMWAFAGHLPTDQVLLLWDTIIAYDSLEILAVLSTAVVVFRRNALLQVKTQAEMDAVLADLSSVKVIPLLYAYLSEDPVIR